jgi:cullin-4
VSKGKAPAGVDMHVSVLTSGFWPTYPIMEARLPQV